MRIVLCNGCFDPFHVGHLWHLQAAKQLGSLLIVSVTRDAHVNKGPGRPVFSETERMAVITSLRCVNGAILSESALDALQKVKPHVFVKGDEYEDKVGQDVRDYCEANGIAIEFTREQRYSSTKLLQHYADQSVGG